ncbi:MAG TPA: hypothetical protein VLA49_16395 [Anaerolineales bacterium]|nr:hypothetical protein [Anaerolineales bacterium]
MNGSPNFFLDNFYTFCRVMLLVPSKIQSWQVEEAALVIFFLILASGVIILCDRLMKRYDLGFATNILVAVGVLCLAVGLTGFMMSVPRLLVSASRPFRVVGIGAPVINFALAAITSMGNRLSKQHSIAGALILGGAGILFGWVLVTTFLLFYLGLYNY